MLMLMLLTRTMTTTRTNEMKIYKNDELNLNKELTNELTEERARGEDAGLSES